MAILSNLSRNFRFNAESRERINRQIQKTSLRIESIQWRILVLQRELKEKHIFLQKLKKTVSGEQTIGLFERVQSGLSWYGDKELTAIGTNFFVTGIPCLSTGKENILRSHIKRVLSEKDLRKSIAYQKLDLKVNAILSPPGAKEHWQSFTPRAVLVEQTPPTVANLALSAQVCSESIASHPHLNVNPFFGSVESTQQICSAGLSPSLSGPPWNSSGTIDEGFSEVDTVPSAVEVQQDIFVHTPAMDNKNREDNVGRRANDLPTKSFVRDASLSVERPRLNLELSTSGMPAKSEHYFVQPASNRSLSSKNESLTKLSFSSTDYTSHTYAALKDQYFRSIERNDLQAMKSALDLGVKVESRNEQNNTGLILASMNGCLEIVKYLLEVGSTGHVNLANEDGFTALHWAAKNGSKDIVACLLENNADINALNKFHQSPIMLAGRYGHCDVVEVLLKHGCELDRRDRNGRNVLMMAARNGHVLVVQALLGENVSVNLVDLRGKTALILMAENAILKTIRGLKLLLQHGADARIDDDDGFCALDYLGKRVKTGAVPLNDDVRSIAMQMRRTFERTDSLVDLRLLPTTQ